MDGNDNPLDPPTLVETIKQMRAELDDALTRECNVRAEIRLKRAAIREARRTFVEVMRSPRRKAAPKPAKKKAGGRRKRGSVLVTPLDPQET